MNKSTSEEGAKQQKYCPKRKEGKLESETNNIEGLGMLVLKGLVEISTSKFYVRDDGDDDDDDDDDAFFLI